MTLPWLRNPFVFVHGNNNNLSSPFAAGKLPTKSETHDANNRNLTFVIIATFTQKEISLEPYLTGLLRKNGIQIITGEESTSTMGLTTATENILTLGLSDAENINAASPTQCVTDSLTAPNTAQLLASEDQAHKTLPQNQLRTQFSHTIQRLSNSSE